MPAIRCAVLECLSRRADEPSTIADLQEATGLPQKTVERVVEDVVSLKLATREKVSNRWHIGLSSIAREYWDSEFSPETSDPPDDGDPVLDESTRLRRVQAGRGAADEPEPTLDEALRDSELFERFVKPYGTLVDNNDELDDARGDLDPEEIERLADIARALQRDES